MKHLTLQRLHLVTELVTKRYNNNINNYNIVTVVVELKLLKTSFLPIAAGFFNQQRRG